MVRIRQLILRPAAAERQSNRVPSAHAAARPMSTVSAFAVRSRRSARTSCSGLPRAYARSEQRMNALHMTGMSAVRPWKQGGRRPGKTGRKIALEELARLSHLTRCLDVVSTAPRHQSTGSGSTWFLRRSLMEATGNRLIGDSRRMQGRPAGAHHAGGLVSGRTRGTTALSERGVACRSVDLLLIVRRVHSRRGRLHLRPLLRSNRIPIL